jgi:hypothetical protein
MNIFYGGTDGGYYPCQKEHHDIGYTDGSPFLTATEFIPNFNKEQKILGYTYGYMANRGEFRSPRGRRSQELLYQLNNNWICLTVTNYQKTYHSTDIYSDHMRTPTDRDVAFVIEDAHRRNVKVCLKPMLNLDDNVWRAHIGFPDLNMDDLNIYWEKWFESYKNFILHYAELAQELKAGNIGAFLDDVKASGNSSFKYLQNVYSNQDIKNQNVSLALFVSEMFLGQNGVCRVHGGGFAGTIQAFVKNGYVENYKYEMDKIFGKDSCKDLRIRKYGGIKVL